MKKLIIRWSNKQLAKMLNEDEFKKMNYATLATKYYIVDIIPQQQTGEPMIILQGLKQTQWIGNHKKPTRNTE